MDELGELQAARARLVSTLVGGRRRAERALHEGVQQDLTALSIRLQLARECATVAPSSLPELLEELRQEVHEALDAVRRLADDVYPALLDAEGLALALLAAAREAGVSLRFEGAVDRASHAAEAVALFACRDVLGAMAAGSRVTASVRATDEGLLVELDGVAEAPPLAARDLVEGAGGTVAVDGSRLVLSIRPSPGRRGRR